MFRKLDMLLISAKGKMERLADRMIHEEKGAADIVAILQLFRRVESKPCCDRKLFSPKIPDDHRVFHHMNPADGVGYYCFREGY